MFNRLYSKVIESENKIPCTTGSIDKLQHNNDKQNLENKIEDVDKKVSVLLG